MSAIDDLQFVLEFLWTNAVDPIDDSLRVLEAGDLAAAKFEAALTFAGTFQGPPPTAYRLLQNGATVYSFP